MQRCATFGQNILKISQRLSEKAEVLQIGQELGIPDSTIDSIFAKHHPDICESTRQIFLKWLKNQESYEQAHQLLGKALVKCEQKMIARKILNYPPMKDS